MTDKALIEALERTDGVERIDDAAFRFGKDQEGTFYFGRQGAVAVAKVREVQLRGDVLELVTAEDRAHFVFEELMGFKIKIADSGDRGGARAGFSSR